MMIELVEITAITKTIEHVRDRQRAAYEQLSSKKTIARYIASTHVEFCDQLLQAIGKMEKTEITPPQWIPFSKATPEDGEWAFFTNGKIISYERYKKDAMDHFFPTGRFFELEDAVAWMPKEAFGPLPENWMTWEDLWIKDFLGE